MRLIATDCNIYPQKTSVYSCTMNAGIHTGDTKYMALHNKYVVYCN